MPDFAQVIDKIRAFFPRDNLYNLLKEAVVHSMECFAF